MREGSVCLSKATSNRTSACMATTIGVKWNFHSLKQLCGSTCNLFFPVFVRKLRWNLKDFVLMFVKGRAQLSGSVHELHKYLHQSHKIGCPFPVTESKYNQCCEPIVRKNSCLSLIQSLARCSLSWFCQSNTEMYLNCAVKFCLIIGKWNISMYEQKTTTTD